MSVIGRSLYSASESANTGLHSTSVIPGLGPGATFTVFFAIYSTGSNSFDTVWANGDGDCQLFMDNSGQLTARYGNSSSSSGAKVSLPQDEWCFVACKFGLDFDGNDDVGLEIYRTGDDSTDYVEQGTSTVASSIEGDEIHYVLSDDPGGTGGPSDDGFRAYLFGLALVDGLWSLDELGCDTTIGEAKNFDAGAEAALIYALRGQDNTDPGKDNSGNGNDFTVESGGVVLSEAMLPPGVSIPSGATTHTSTLGLASSSNLSTTPRAAWASTIAVAASTTFAAAVLSSLSADFSSGGSTAFAAVPNQNYSTAFDGQSSTSFGANGDVVSGSPGSTEPVVQFPVGGTGSADFADDALDAGWSEGTPGSSGYSGWSGWTYSNGRAVAEFALSDTGDAGTNSSAGQGVPRLVRDVSDTDFQLDFAVASAIYEDQTGSSQYVGTGFYLELGNGNSARLDHYRISGSNATKGYRNLAGSATSSGIDPINAGAGNTNRGHPGFFRLTRVGDVFTVYCSYDGVIFRQTDQFTWAVSIAKVGVLAYKIGTSCTATIALEYIHLNQTGGFSVSNEPVQTNLLTEDFSDLANWSDTSSGTASISAGSGKFTMSVPGGDTHSARLMFPTAKQDAGMLMRVQTSTTVDDQNQGFFCPAFRQRGNIIEPFGQAVGYVFEINAQDNDIRIVSSQSEDFTSPLFDGVYSYLHEDLALSGLSLESNLTWLRLECFGPVLRWKYWTDGETEPAGWNATIYDTTIPEEGYLGIVYAHNRTMDTVLTADIDHLEVYELSAPLADNSTTFSASTGSSFSATPTLVKNVDADLSGSSSASFAATHVAASSYSVAGSSQLLVQSTLGQTGYSSFSGSSEMSISAEIVSSAQFDLIGSTSIGMLPSLTEYTSFSGSGSTTFSATPVEEQNEQGELHLTGSSSAVIGSPQVIRGASFVASGQSACLMYAQATVQAQITLSTHTQASFFVYSEEEFRIELVGAGTQQSELMPSLNQSEILQM